MFKDNLYSINPDVETRWASHENPLGLKGEGGKARNGRKGSAWFTLEDGQDAVLAQAENTSGMIRRIWITINTLTKETLRGIMIEMYWDGADTPAVSASLSVIFSAMGSGAWPY